MDTRDKPEYDKEEKLPKYDDIKKHKCDNEEKTIIHNDHKLSKNSKTRELRYFNILLDEEGFGAGSISTYLSSHLVLLSLKPNLSKIHNVLIFFLLCDNTHIREV